MPTFTIEGSSNIANSGTIQGDCIENNTVYNLNLYVFDLLKNCKMNEDEKSLVNMTEAQKKLAEAINKFAQAELIKAEADKLRAKADENNSLANLNYSKIMLEDRTIIKQMMEKLK